MRRILRLFAVGDELGVHDQAADVALRGVPGVDLALEPLQRAIRPREGHLLIVVNVALQAAPVNGFPVRADLLKYVVVAGPGDVLVLQPEIGAASGH